MDGPTDHVNEGVGESGNGFNINFTKAKAKFCLSLYYNSGESYLYVNKTDF